MPSRNTPLTIAEVLVEEFEHIHGPVPAACRGDQQTLERIQANFGFSSLPDPRAGVAELRAADDRRQGAFFEAVAALRESRAALCLSGGGIRSATFSLGVIQAFARWGVLGRFHYLSTVSGGGYIGSWLSTWIRRCGYDSVMAALARPGTVEPEPLRHLRAFSNYLAPRKGLSTDTLTVVATFLRNLLLNWAVIIPLLLAVLALPRLLIAAIWIPSAPAVSTAAQAEPPRVTH